jgi:hypothetical protein
MFAWIRCECCAKMMDSLQNMQQKEGFEVKCAKKGVLPCG